MQKTAQDYVDQLLQQYFNKKSTELLRNPPKTTRVCLKVQLFACEEGLNHGRGLNFIFNFNHQLQSQDKARKFTKIPCVMKSFL